MHLALQFFSNCSVVLSFQVLLKRHFKRLIALRCWLCDKNILIATINASYHLLYLKKCKVFHLIFLSIIHFSLNMVSVTFYFEMSSTDFLVKAEQDCYLFQLKVKSSIGNLTFIAFIFSYLWRISHPWL